MSIAKCDGQFATPSSRVGHKDRVTKNPDWNNKKNELGQHWAAGRGGRWGKKRGICSCFRGPRGPGRRRRRHRTRTSRPQTHRRQTWEKNHVGRLPVRCSVQHGNPLPRRPPRREPARHRRRGAFCSVFACRFPLFHCPCFNIRGPRAEPRWKKPRRSWAPKRSVRVGTW